MKRFCAVAVLMLLGSPAHAGESFSFVIGGHHIHIEASRHCNSTSCVSVSIPGIYEKRARFYRYDDDAPNAPPPAPVAASVAPPASTPQAPPVACAPAAVPVRPVAAQIVTALQPQIQPAPIQPATIAAVPPPQPAPPAIAPPPPSPPPAIARPAEAALPPPPAAAPPRLSKVVHRVEEEPDSPLGDWQTEGHKGLVRIEPCGQALCGYVLDSFSNAKGETVLIDMKSKAAAEWSGNIYSRDSGNTYYATMTLKGPDSLQVEACALGRFFCSGNAWSRIAKPDRLITYRQTSTEPRS
jgi:Uncharacterized protein conserved in bacteria (DUF2147)